MKVLLRNPDAIDGRDYRSLTVGREYVVLGLESDCYRLLDDNREPILFDPENFDVTDSQEPSFWVSHIGEEGERSAYPVAWDAPGYFEDWHDGVEMVRQSFTDQLNLLYPQISLEQR
ncbi:MAG: hypothetical protein JWP89_1119 [Schlesneria sp.]|nr:hypothetical protein [Schlesneria sp.]